MRIEFSKKIRVTCDWDGLPKNILRTRVIPEGEPMYDLESSTAQIHVEPGGEYYVDGPLRRIRLKELVPAKVYFITVEGDKPEAVAFVRQRLSDHYVVADEASPAIKMQPTGADLELDGVTWRALEATLESIQRDADGFGFADNVVVRVSAKN